MSARNHPHTCTDLSVLHFGRFCPLARAITLAVMSENFSDKAEARSSYVLTWGEWASVWMPLTSKDLNLGNCALVPKGNITISDEPPTASVWSCSSLCGLFPIRGENAKTVQLYLTGSCLRQRNVNKSVLTSL